jgi:hypothetical protein
MSYIQYAEVTNEELSSNTSNPKESTYETKSTIKNITKNTFVHISRKRKREEMEN